MIKIYALLAALLLTSSTGYSLISKKEWVSLCRRAKGERKHTCNVIRKALRISPLPFGNWGKVYDLISKAIKLNLVDKRISDLSPLSELTNLDRLLLSWNNISDLSPLSGLHNLDLLYLHNNQISDLSPLRSLKNLSIIDLSYNQIYDLSPLSESTNLRYLTLRGNHISNLNPLAGLTNIRRLNLENNRISDLSPLSGFNRLDLDLEGNNILDPSPLAEIPNLDVSFEDDYLSIKYADARYSRNRNNRVLSLKKTKQHKLINRSPRNEINNEEIICSICLQEYREDDELSELPGCHHLFHKNCLGKWIAKHGNCPYCKIPVVKE